MANKKGSKQEQHKSFVRETGKQFVKALTFGSVFDKDFTEENLEKMRPVTDRQLMDHITGKKKLTREELDHAIKQQKLISMGGKYL
ncbi:hypothetical protein M5W68_13665 [Paenibacillus larvae]|uniref:hypothetical protein n=1 Tax=Paenibacillus larvae TaxID=1464 RepID=UPI00227E7EEF|nr:hypothetical protein [Paenibacillus larvae]MCY9509561.1 hypothetical protein [Paenibacillus larvae]MCY9526126.1 hypothetical protein [Paenibacillus larvae]